MEFCCFSCCYKVVGGFPVFFLDCSGVAGEFFFVLLCDFCDYG